MHPDLIIATKLLYEPNNLIIENLHQEKESKEYGACEFILNQKHIQFRIAKITPTKVGQFVTIWKRIGSGPIIPFDLADAVDFFIISVRADNHLGQFIFPKSVLYLKGYISKDDKGGKRAIRVYSPWDNVESPIAGKTQKWQLNYFIEISPNKFLDKEKIKDLFSKL